MDIYQLNPETPHSRYIVKAAGILNDGGLIVYPTDVNYGIGCLLSSAKGVRCLNDLTKGLGRNKLHTIICRDFSEISKYARVGNDTFRLIKKVMPGPYTIILEATTLVPKVCHTRRSTIGVRMMDHPVMNALFEQLDSPVLNFTALPTDVERITESPEEVEELYANSVSAFLSVGSIKSEHTTVIDLTGTSPIVVRQGLGPAIY